MKTPIFLLFVFSFSLFSCTKFGKTYRVKGKVINPITGEGIAGAHVTLSKFTLGISGGSKTQKRVVTDENGNFDISKLAFRNDGIAVPVLPGNDYEDWYRIGWTRDGGKTIKDFKVPFGKTIHADYYAVPYGELKISIHNVNCQGPDDSIYFERIYQTDLNSNIFQPFTFTGCYDNEGAFAKVPCGQYLIKWKVTKSGISANFTHLISVNENQQSYYNIDY